MSTIGIRLREERERLGLNQTAFGELGGVQKRAQINYEKDERLPDAGYLSALSGANVDVLYVLTGNRSRPLVPPSSDTVSDLVRGKAIRESDILSGRVAKELKRGELVKDLTLGKEIKDLTLGEKMNDLTLGKNLSDSGVLPGSALEQAGLNRREQALLANYRGSDERGRKAIEGAASELSLKDGEQSKRQGGE
ncbi:helix-turn-helix transcriptional regulator [Pseudomonas sp.]|uniref:helix-turn-helix domain-containing protein n=1 Tax=Pseudomonas sp. TaxID=306 RepID=UPI0028A95C15|nr:helix-turn-helix transcriptional regulator [Pseudomonas sp.]